MLITGLRWPRSRRFPGAPCAPRQYVDINVNLCDHGHGAHTLSAMTTPASVMPLQTDLRYLPCGSVCEVKVTVVSAVATATEP